MSEDIPVRDPSGQALVASLPEPVPVSALTGDDPSRELIAHGLNALAERCEKAPHMSRDLDADLKIVERALFSQNYTGSLDAATRLIPDGFVWCAGTAYSDDDDRIYSWANVRTLDPYSRIDCSTRGATTALALCSAALRCRAAQAMSAGTAETPKVAQGEARQRGPKDAPEPSQGQSTLSSEQEE